MISLLQILIAIAPIYILIFLGFLYSRYKVIAEEDLVSLLFNIIMPAQIFISLIQNPMEIKALINFLAVIIPSSFVVILITAITLYYVCQNNLKNLILNCMASIHINVAFIALPIFQILFSDIEEIIYIIFYQMFITICIIYLLERFVHADITKNNFLNTIKTPIIFSAILGLLLNCLGITVPGVILSSVNIIAKSASFLSLFLLGASFTHYVRLHHIFILSKTSIFILLLKNIIYPIMCLFIGNTIFNLTSKELLRMVLIAAMPIGNNYYIYSKRYNIKNESNKMLLLSTLISMISITIIITLFSL